MTSIIINRISTTYIFKPEGQTDEQNLMADGRDVSVSDDAPYLRASSFSGFPTFVIRPKQPSRLAKFEAIHICVFGREKGLVGVDEAVLFQSPPACERMCKESGEQPIETSRR